MSRKVILIDAEGPIVYSDVQGDLSIMLVDDTESSLTALVSPEFGKATVHTVGWAKKEEAQPPASGGPTLVGGVGESPGIRPETEDALQTAIFASAVNLDAEERNFVAQVESEDGLLRRAFIRQIARRSGASQGVVAARLSEVEDDTGRPFLSWLLNGGLEKLIQLILGLIKAA